MAAGDQSAGPAPVAGEPSADVARGLRDPAVYGVEEVEVRETHISWVFLAGERAYKLKKPVRLPFVDYGTAERRRHMCEEEVRLNRRLAADVYLGVRAVVRGGARLELDEPDHPDAVAHVVEMRRFDERRTLAALLGRGEPGSLEPLARLLARFHDAAPVIERADPVGALRDTFEENSATLRGLVPGEHAADVNALDRFAWSYLAAHEARIRRRARAGRVRDGHGDLRTDHVLLEDGPRVVDCVEFAPHLRQIDTANDLSYLVMDLVARGAPAAAQQLLDAYRAAGGTRGTTACSPSSPPIAHRSRPRWRSCAAAGRRRRRAWPGSRSGGASRGGHGCRSCWSWAGCRPAGSRGWQSGSATATARR